MKKRQKRRIMRRRERNNYLAFQVDSSFLRENSTKRLQEDRLLIVARNHQLQGGGSNTVSIVIAGHTLPLTLNDSNTHMSQSIHIKYQQQ